MYDRPNLQELIDAARQHMEQAVIPAVQSDPKLYFQTLVAINVLKIAARELELGSSHAQAEWHGLDALDLPEGVSSEHPIPQPHGPMPQEPHALQDRLSERNQQLCQAIRRGEYDTEGRWGKLFAHVKVTTIAQLEVSNPRFLKNLAAEDGHPRAETSTSTHPRVEL